MARIKRQCICSTDLNAEMIPALKNKSIVKQLNEEMREHKLQPVIP